MKVKELLNTLFVDTLLRWKSGEKNNRIMQEDEIQNEKRLSLKGSCKNIMGRRSDMILYNNKKVPLCLSEVEDGRSTAETVSQESKSIRCSKSLQVYNTCLKGPDSIWPLDWCGKYEGVDVILPGKKLAIPKTEEELDDLEMTLVALYELKHFLMGYNGDLEEDFVEEHEEGLIFHTP
ncbi:hypothetical protein BD560DRAFT_458107 [Blakeslea trispora]|nr:hypothetical protein BD560DRAFT_458107 [Blakeslea trispora]